MEIHKMNRKELSMDDDGDIFALINEECEINDKWEEERCRN